jgi:hypothetical protein
MTMIGKGRRMFRIRKAVAPIAITSPFMGMSLQLQRML